MRTEVVFVADLGGLKIYQVDRSSTPTLRLEESHTIEEGTGRYADKLTDQAGAFPNAGSNGQANSIAERLNFEGEYRERAIRSVADKIRTDLERRRPKRWSLAAPSPINANLLSKIPAEWHASLDSNLKKDLVNQPSDQVLQQLASA